MKLKPSIILFLLMISVVLTSCELNDPVDFCSEDNIDLHKSYAIQLSEEIPDILNAAGFPIVRWPLTLNFMGRKQVTHTDWHSMLVWQEYEKKTGIHIEWNTPLQNVYQEKKSLAFAIGELPDAFFKGFLSNSELVNYGSQGLLIELTELIEKYAPNIKSILEKYPEVKKSITTPEGKIYSIPQVHIKPTSLITNKLYINKKWLEALKLSEPETTEEYYYVLKAFKTGDPNGNELNDEIPLLSEKGGAAFEEGASNVISSLLGSFGLGNRGRRYIDQDEEGRIRFISADENYREMLIYINKLYKEGLMDPQSLVQDRKAAIAKGSIGLAGSAFLDNIDMIGVVPKDWNNYVVLSPLEGPKGERIYSDVRPMVSRAGAFAITKVNENPEATMRWIDYFFSEEGVTLYYCGIEGITYARTSDGSLQYTDIIKNNPDGLNINQALGQYTPLPGGCDPIVYMYNKSELMSKEQNEIYLRNYEKVKAFAPDEAWPEFMFTGDEQSDLAVIERDIYVYVNEMSAKFIMGTEPFTSWEKYLKTLDQIGLERFMKINEEAYRRWAER